VDLRIRYLKLYSDPVRDVEAQKNTFFTAESALADLHMMENCQEVSIREEVARMPIIRKMVRSDCAGCNRESYCYFGVAFKSFPALSRVVFDNDGFTSCWKAGNNTTQKDEE
jgi:hypothetical protein